MQLRPYQNDLVEQVRKAWRDGARTVPPRRRRPARRAGPPRQQLFQIRPVIHVPVIRDVRGGGPAARESQLLNPLMSAQVLHAIVLAGGSFNSDRHRTQLRAKDCRILDAPAPEKEARA